MLDTSYQNFQNNRVFSACVNFYHSKQSSISIFARKIYRFINQNCIFSVLFKFSFCLDHICKFVYQIWYMKLRKLWTGKKNNNNLLNLREQKKKSNQKRRRTRLFSQFILHHHVTYFTLICFKKLWYFRASFFLRNIINIFCKDSKEKSKFIQMVSRVQILWWVSSERLWGLKLI